MSCPSLGTYPCYFSDGIKVVFYVQSLLKLYHTVICQRPTKTVFPSNVSVCTLKGIRMWPTSSNPLPEGTVERVWEERILRFLNSTIPILSLRGVRVLSVFRIMKTPHHLGFAQTETPFQYLGDSLSYLRERGSWVLFRKDPFLIFVLGEEVSSPSLERIRVLGCLYGLYPNDDDALPVL